MDWEVCMALTIDSFKMNQIDVGHILATETKGPVKLSDLYYACCVNHCILLMMLSRYAVPLGVSENWMPWSE